MQARQWLLGTLLITVLCWAGDVSHSAEFYVKNKNLHISGRIMQGDLERLKQQVAGNYGLKINLNSKGGNLFEALSMGSFIREKGMETHVANDVICASACVTIFAGGLIRTAGPNAKLGIHMASGVFDETFVDGITDIILEYGVEATPIITRIFEQLAAKAMIDQVYFMLSSGISLQVLERTASTPHDQIYWVSHQEAIQMNLINHW